MCRCTPCAELLVVSRVTDLKMIKNCNTLYELDWMSTLKIGQGKAADIHKEFENQYNIESNHVYFAIYIENFA